MLVWFANLWLHLPGDRWRDITDTLPAGSPPTLAVEGGIGALQFTVGLYKSGPIPNIDAKALERLLYQFEDAQGFARTRKASSWHNEFTFGLSCDYSIAHEFIRVWYCSNGESIAFITFVTDKIDDDVRLNQELHDAQAIAHSMRFERP